MSEQHRRFFNERAADWDRLVDDNTLQRLSLIINRIKVLPGSVVLDVGAGSGILIPFLKEAVGASGCIVALDLAEEMLKRAREKHGDKRISYVRGDISDALFADSFFDEIICNSCFPHVQDKKAAAREMLRVLKPGGRVTICHTESREKMNAMHRSLGGVVGEDMLPDDHEMQSMFEQAGFANIEISNSPSGYLFTASKKING